VFVFSSSGGTLMTRVKFVSKQSCSHFSLQQLIFVGKKDYSLDVSHLFKNLRLGLLITKSSFKSRRFKERITVSDSHDSFYLFIATVSSFAGHHNSVLSTFSQEFLVLKGSLAKMTQRWRPVDSCSSYQLIPLFLQVALNPEAVVN
jgi:hypothetical protein